MMVTIIITIATIIIKMIFINLMSTHTNNTMKKKASKTRLKRHYGVIYPTPAKKFE